VSFGKAKNEIKIRFCGLGGMGVILVSVILGKAAIYDGKNAAQTQSYGSEQRGTKVRSDVVISTSELIAYPIIDIADILVALSQEAFDYYIKNTDKSSLVLINSDLVHTNTINNYIKIPATTLARSLHNEKVVNIIMLGVLIKKTNLVSLESLKKSINETFSKKYRELNLKALTLGYNLSDETK